MARKQAEPWLTLTRYPTLDPERDPFAGFGTWILEAAPKATGHAGFRAEYVGGPERLRAIAKKLDPHYIEREAKPSEWGGHLLWHDMTWTDDGPVWSANGEPCPPPWALHPLSLDDTARAEAWLADPTSPPEQVATVHRRRDERAAHAAEANARARKRFTIPAERAAMTAIERAADDERRRELETAYFAASEAATAAREAYREAEAKARVAVAAARDAHLHARAVDVDATRAENAWREARGLDPIRHEHRC